MCFRTDIWQNNYFSKHLSTSTATWNLESCRENASGRKIVIPKEDINYDNQKSYSDYDEYTNDAGNVVKLNRHLIMDTEILENHSRTH